MQLGNENIHLGQNPIGMRKKFQLDLGKNPIQIRKPN